jgi:hypothetical protein
MGVEVIWTTPGSHDNQSVVALSLIEDIINISQITVPALQQIYSLEGSDARTLAVEIQSIIEELPQESRQVRY